MNEKTVLITGASAGIGLQSAIGLAKLGAEVVMVGRDAERTAQAVVPGSSINRIVQMLLPKRVVDNIIAKNLGFK